jgi:hypothetical protein
VKGPWENSVFAPRAVNGRGASRFPRAPVETHSHACQLGKSLLDQLALPHPGSAWAAWSEAGLASLSRAVVPRLLSMGLCAPPSSPMILECISNMLGGRGRLKGASAGCKWERGLKTRAFALWKGTHPVSQGFETPGVILRHVCVDGDPQASPMDDVWAAPGQMTQISVPKALQPT